MNVPAAAVTKPRVLRLGGTIALVSPASTPKPELVEAGAAELARCGYRTRIFPSALARGPLYFAGTVAERVADLHAAFSDPAIDAILCTRGGWGSAELLPHLDANLIGRHPKPFIGFSDLTSLHVWLRNETGMVTFHGPMASPDWSRAEGVERVSWRHALEGSAGWSLGADHGLRVLRSGVAEGELGGGCLAIYAEAIGTPYAPRPRGGVLFLEDVGVKPYQWDRMLLHVRYAGLLAGVQGIVFGDMAQSSEPEEMPLLEAALLHALRDFGGPVAIGLRSGHVADSNITLPLGVRVRLDCTDERNPRMHFLEAAVSG